MFRILQMWSESCISLLLEWSPQNLATSPAACSDETLTSLSDKTDCRRFKGGCRMQAFYPADESSKVQGCKIADDGKRFFKRWVLCADGVLKGEGV